MWKFPGKSSEGEKHDAPERGIRALPWDYVGNIDELSLVGVKQRGRGDPIPVKDWRALYRRFLSVFYRSPECRRLLLAHVNQLSETGGFILASGKDHVRTMRKPEALDKKKGIYAELDLTPTLVFRRLRSIIKSCREDLQNFTIYVEESRIPETNSDPAPTVVAASDPIAKPTEDVFAAPPCDKFVEEEGRFPTPDDFRRPDARSQTNENDGASTETSAPTAQSAERALENVRDGESLSESNLENDENRPTIPEQSAPLSLEKTSRENPLPEREFSNDATPNVERADDDARREDEEPGRATDVEIPGEARENALRLDWFNLPPLENTTPVAAYYNGFLISVADWRELYVLTLRMLFDERSDDFLQNLDDGGYVNGRRIFYSQFEADCSSDAVPIGVGVYVDERRTPDQIASNLRDVFVDFLGMSPRTLQVFYANKERPAQLEESAPNAEDASEQTDALTAEDSDAIERDAIEILVPEARAVVGQEAPTSEDAPPVPQALEEESQDDERDENNIVESAEEEPNQNAVEAVEASQDDDETEEEEAETLAEDALAIPPEDDDTNEDAETQNNALGEVAEGAFDTTAEPSLEIPPETDELDYFPNDAVENSVDEALAIPPEEDDERENATANSNADATPSAEPNVDERRRDDYGASDAFERDDDATQPRDESARGENERETREPTLELPPLEGEDADLVIGSEEPCEDNPLAFAPEEDELDDEAPESETPSVAAETHATNDVDAASALAPSDDDDDSRELEPCETVEPDATEEIDEASDADDAEETRANDEGVEALEDELVESVEEKPEPIAEESDETSRDDGAETSALDESCGPATTEEEANGEDGANELAEADDADEQRASGQVEETLADPESNEAPTNPTSMSKYSSALVNLDWSLKDSLENTAPVAVFVKGVGKSVSTWRDVYVVILSELLKNRKIATRIKKLLINPREQRLPFAREANADKLVDPCEVAPGIYAETAVAPEEALDWIRYLVNRFSAGRLTDFIVRYQKLEPTSPAPANDVGENDVRERVESSDSVEEPPTAESEPAEDATPDGAEQPDGGAVERRAEEPTESERELEKESAEVEESEDGDESNRATVDAAPLTDVAPLDWNAFPCLENSRPVVAQFDGGALVDVATWRELYLTALHELFAVEAYARKLRALRFPTGAKKKFRLFGASEGKRCFVKRQKKRAMSDPEEVADGLFVETAISDRQVALNLRFFLGEACEDPSTLLRVYLAPSDFTTEQIQKGLRNFGLEYDVVEEEENETPEAENASTGEESDGAPEQALDEEAATETSADTTLNEDDDAASQEADVAPTVPAPSTECECEYEYKTVLLDWNADLALEKTRPRKITVLKGPCRKARSWRELYVEFLRALFANSKCADRLERIVNRTRKKTGELFLARGMKTIGMTESKEIAPDLYAEVGFTNDQFLEKIRYLAVNVCELKLSEVVIEYDVPVPVANPGDEETQAGSAQTEATRDETIESQPIEKLDANVVEPMPTQSEVETAETAQTALDLGTTQVEPSDSVAAHEDATRANDRERDDDGARARDERKTGGDSSGNATTKELAVEPEVFSDARVNEVVNADENATPYSSETLTEVEIDDAIDGVEELDAALFENERLKEVLLPEQDADERQTLAPQGNETAPDANDTDGKEVEFVVDDRQAEKTSSITDVAPNEVVEEGTVPDVGTALSYDDSPETPSTVTETEISRLDAQDGEAIGDAAMEEPADAEQDVVNDGGDAILLDLNNLQSLTNTRPVAAFYRNKSIPAPFWSKLYVNVLRELLADVAFQDDRVDDICVNQRRIFYSKRRKSEAPKPVMVASGVYVNVDRDANRIARNLRDVLLDFCHEPLDSLRIFFQPKDRDSLNPKDQKISPETEPSKDQRIEPDLANDQNKEPEQAVVEEEPDLALFDWRSLDSARALKNALRMPPYKLETPRVSLRVSTWKDVFLAVIRELYHGYVGVWLRAKADALAKNAFVVHTARRDSLVAPEKIARNLWIETFCTSDFFVKTLKSLIEKNDERPQDYKIWLDPNKIVELEEPSFDDDDTDDAWEREIPVDNEGEEKEAETSSVNEQEIQCDTIEVNESAINRQGAVEKLDEIEHVLQLDCELPNDSPYFVMTPYEVETPYAFFAVSTWEEAFLYILRDLYQRHPGAREFFESQLDAPDDDNVVLVSKSDRRALDGFMNIGGDIYVEGECVPASQFELLKFFIENVGANLAEYKIRFDTNLPIQPEADEITVEDDEEESVQETEEIEEQEEEEPDVEPAPEEEETLETSEESEDEGEPENENNDTDPDYVEIVARVFEWNFGNNSEAFATSPCQVETPNGLYDLDSWRDAYLAIMRDLYRFGGKQTLLDEIETPNSRATLVSNRNINALTDPEMIANDLWIECAYEPEGYAALLKYYIEKCGRRLDQYKIWLITNDRSEADGEDDWKNDERQELLKEEDVCFELEYDEEELDDKEEIEEDESDEQILARARQTLKAVHAFVGECDPREILTYDLIDNPVGLNFEALGLVGSYLFERLYAFHDWKTLYITALKQFYYANESAFRNEANGRAFRTSLRISTSRFSFLGGEQIARGIWADGDIRVDQMATNLNYLVGRLRLPEGSIRIVFNFMNVKYGKSFALQDRERFAPLFSKEEIAALERAGDVKPLASSEPVANEPDDAPAVRAVALPQKLRTINWDAIPNLDATIPYDALCLGERKQFNNWQALYVWFVKKMYEKYRDEMRDKLLDKKVYFRDGLRLVSDRDHFTQPVRIDSDVYLRPNCPATNIVYNIRYLVATVCGLELRAFVIRYAPIPRNKTSNDATNPTVISSPNNCQEYDVMKSNLEKARNAAREVFNVVDWKSSIELAHTKPVGLFWFDKMAKRSQWSHVFFYIAQQMAEAQPEKIDYFAKTTDTRSQSRQILTQMASILRLSTESGSIPRTTLPIPSGRFELSFINAMSIFRTSICITSTIRTTTRPTSPTLYGPLENR